MRYRATTFPVALEAAPFALPFAVTGLLCAIFQLWGWAIFLGICFVAIAAFFRNPRRFTPAGRGIVVAPADGKVVAAGVVACPEFEEGQALRVAIFMSLLDVHVNWAPYSGRIENAQHYCGKFLNAMESKACEENERKVLLVRSARGFPFVVKLVAGLVARRIVCPLEPGDPIETGDKIGLIRFGSRVETLLPVTAVLQVGLGARVRGGETVIASFEEPQRRDESGVSPVNP